MLYYIICIVYIYNQTGFPAIQSTAVHYNAKLILIIVYRTRHPWFINEKLNTQAAKIREPPVNEFMACSMVCCIIRS